MLNKKVKKFLSLAIIFSMTLGNFTSITARASSNELDVIVENSTGALDLTKSGTIDWVHLGNQVDRKNISKSIISFERLGEAAETEMTDSPISFNWSDGIPTIIGQDVRKGKVFNSVLAAVGTTPQVEEGYKITIPSDSIERQLIFTTGIWNAKANLIISVNGEEKRKDLLDIKEPAAAKKYTVDLLPGNTYEVKCLYLEKYNQYGNINLTSIALKEKEVISGIAKEELNKLIVNLESVKIEGFTEDSIGNFNSALSKAKEISKNEGSSQDDIGKAYNQLVTAVKNLTSSGKYTNQTADRNLSSSFGWDGDKDAPIAYIDGSYKLRDRNSLIVRFGVADISNKIKWYNEAGYLPCFVSEYNKGDFDVKLKSFSDKVTLEGKDFEVAYSRYSVTNKSSELKLLPIVSPELVPINENAKSKLVINPGETIVRDYAIAADRFGNNYSWPEESLIAKAGDWDQHFNNMQKYWENRLKNIALIEKLPNETLINAYKAGYIYTQIIKDGKEIHVGEEGYDQMWDHDTIGIVSTLFTLGDFTEAKDFLETLPAQLQYDDAKWKFSWPFALYLRRTGDLDYIKSNFNKIKNNTHKIETDRIDNGKGIMKKTYAIDAYGYWTIDNWSALFGLLSYKYVCQQLGETEEVKWAEAEYKDLLSAVNKTLSDTMKKYSLNYIPASMVEPNDFNRCADARDANWASMFLFGRWAWDGYLFNGRQEGVSFEMIDDTYTYGFKRTEDIFEPYNFGGYPHGIYSSAYNAGYGSAALAGEKYRDAGIKGYEFMINNSMSGPFGWWEGIAYPNKSSLWDIPHSPGGGGSCQHMWGQSVSTKVLFDSLIAEKIDGNLIIGRGVPDEWLLSGEEIKISNYAIGNNKRVGFSLISNGTTIKLTMTGDIPENNINLELPFLRNNIKSTTLGSFNYEKGVVTVPKNTRELTVTLQNPVVITEPVKLDAPVLKEVKQQENVVNVSWNQVKNAEGYVVEYKINDDKTNKVTVTDGNSCSINIDKFYPSVNYEFKVYAYAGNYKSEKSNALSLKVDLPSQVDGGNIEMTSKAPASSVNLTEEGTLDWIRVGRMDNTIAERKSGTSKYIVFDKLQKNSISTFGDSQVNFSWRDGTIEPTCDSSTYGLFFQGEGGNIDASDDGWIITAPADTKERVLRIYTSVWMSKESITSYLSDNSAAIKIDSFEDQGGSTYKVYEIKYCAKSNGQTLYVKSHVDKKYNSYGNHTFMAAALQGDVPVIEVKSLTLDKTSLEMITGGEIKLNAAVEPENAVDKSVTWTTSDNKVAAVKDGVVKAIGKGTATITATAGKASAVCKVTVSDPIIEPTAIILDKTSAKMTAGETITLNAKVVPDNATDKIVKWTSSNDKVAAVENGIVKALGEGTAKITASIGKISATCEITVDSLVTDKTNEITSYTKTESGNKTIITVDSNELKKDSENIIKFGTADNNTFEFKFKYEAVKGGNGVLKLIINGVETIEIPFAFLNNENLPDDAVITISRAIELDSTLIKNNKGIKKVYNYNLIVESNGKQTSIHNFKEAKVKITIQLTDEELKGLNRDRLSVFYYNESSNSLEIMDTTLYDNKITFLTPHFSKFIIAEKNNESKIVTLPKTGGMPSSTFILLGCITLVAGIFTCKFKRIKQ